MLAQALQHMRKHDNQMASLRRRAAMTRAVLPNKSEREQWPLAGLLDRAASHWFRAPSLDGGDDEDVVTRTDTTAPDDDNDDTPPAPTSKLQPSRPRTCDRCSRAPLGAVISPNGPAHTGTRRALLRTTGCVLAPSPTLSTSSAWCTSNALCSNHHLQPCS